MLECQTSQSGRRTYYLNGKRVSKSVAESYAEKKNKKIPKCVKRSLKNQSRRARPALKHCSHKKTYSHRKTPRPHRLHTIHR